MKIVRKLVAMILYAVLLLPGAEYRMSSWLQAVEASTAVVDRTMRRRKSRVENERFARFLPVTGEQRARTARHLPLRSWPF